MEKTERSKDMDKNLSEKSQKWNKMWDLWTEGKIESPYGELMTYQGEVYNGGHGQYFCNVDNNGDLRKELSALAKILPLGLRFTLWLAYRAYLFLEKHPDKENVPVAMFLECSSMVFYLYEKRINRMLEAYAETIEL